MFTSRIPYRWVIAIVLMIAYSVQYLDRVKTNVLMPYIAADIGLTSNDIGSGALLMAIFGGSAQMFSGWLTDKYGGRRVLLFSVVTWSSMTAWMGMIETRNEYFVRMALFGFCVGTEYVPSATILVRWFNREGRARAQSLLSWAWILTPAWASVIATQLAFHTGDWRLVFYLTAGLGIFPLALIGIYVYDRPERYPRVTQADLDYAYADEISTGAMHIGQHQNGKAQIRASNRIKCTEFFKSASFNAAICIAIVMQIIMYSALVWIPLYLSDVFSFRLDVMGMWSAAYFVAGAAGSFVSSYLSDTICRGNRRTMIFVSLIGVLPFVAALANIQDGNSRMLLIAMCGMGFFGNMAWGPLLAVPAEIFTPEVYGKAMGLMNGIAHTIAAFAAKTFGLLVYMEDGQKLYSSGWYFICVCVGFGILATLFLRTKGTVFNSTESSP